MVADAAPHRARRRGGARRRCVPVPEPDAPALDGAARGAVARRTTSSSRATARPRGGWCGCCDGSRIPFVITTLSPEGANEAEAAGLAGAARRREPAAHAAPRRRRPRQGAGGRRRRPRHGPPHRRGGARSRIRRCGSSSARATSPRCEPLRAAGADRVVADELESVVQLFADVMRSYDLPPRGDRAPRGGDPPRRLRRAAQEERPAAPVVECDRSAGLPGAPHGDGPGRRARRSASALAAAAGSSSRRLRRGGADRASPPRAASRFGPATSWCSRARPRRSRRPRRCSAPAALDAVAMAAGAGGHSHR